jgi:hypothetical protein
MKITIDKKAVAEHEILPLLDYLGDWYLDKDIFTEQQSGTSEYRLYAYLSEYFDDTTILDIGTRTGGSGLALSWNPNNRVISFDLVRWPSHDHLKKDNLDLRIGNFMEDETIDYDDVSIIMIDVDPHDGVQEPPMLEFLREKNWNGLLLLDDIGPIWPAIEAMWNEIPEPKFDLTDIGHFSGTGLVVFGDEYEVEVV